MACPRCAGPLDHYALQGREALVCEDCGYIDVPVEHHSDAPEIESWDDAVNRKTTNPPLQTATITTDDTPIPPQNGDTYECDECGARFDTAASLHGHQAVHTNSTS